MRSLTSRAVVLGACLGAAVISSGCEGKKATEYVAGISTQITVPRDLKAVRVEVTVGGFSRFCQAYKVYDGKVQLPRSLGSYPANDSALKTNHTITYTIVGLTEEYDPGSENPLYALCATPEVGQNGARILRRSRQPYVPGEILFIPMPLKYSCYDKHCGEDETCKGGKCVPATVADPAATFARYSPDLADGSGGACFSAQTCMGATLPAIVVDPETCTYAVAGSASAPPPLDPSVDPFRPPCADASECASGVCTDAQCEPLAPEVPWDGVNVSVVYDGGIGREILDKDPDEGFTIPDPDKPQQFRLAEGLCEMVKGLDAQGDPTAHRITAVRASGVCQSKSIHQPLCEADQLAAMGLDEHGVAPNPAAECSVVELQPPPAALMVVADNTEPHRMFFNVEELKALELPLRDPALAQTDLGLLYTNGGDDAATCDAARAPVIGLERSWSVREHLIDSFLSYSADPSKLEPGPVSLGGALSSAYEALSSAATGYHRRAVVVLANRGFDDASVCGGSGPVAKASAAVASDPAIETYVLELVKNDPDVALADDVIDPAIHALAQAGLPSGRAPYDPDARADKRVAKEAFQRIIESLATCVYDVDSGRAPSASDVLSFTNPLDGATTTILPNAACDAEDVAGEGWGFSPDAPGGKRRVVLCADSCTAYRQILRTSSDFALLYQQPAYAVPMFAHKGDCGTK